MSGIIKDKRSWFEAKEPSLKVLLYTYLINDIFLSLKKSSLLLFDEKWLNFYLKKKKTFFLAGNFIYFSVGLLNGQEDWMFFFTESLLKVSRWETVGAMIQCYAERNICWPLSLEMSRARPSNTCNCLDVSKKRKDRILFPVGTQILNDWFSHLGLENGLRIITVNFLSFIQLCRRHLTVKRAERRMSNES